MDTFLRNVELIVTLAATGVIPGAIYFYQPTP
jgi:hypothetical protein